MHRITLGVLAVAGALLFPVATSADTIVGVAPMTGGVTFSTPYPDCPTIGPDQFTFSGLATGLVVDPDVIAGYDGSIAIAANGGSSGAFCDAAETGSLTVTQASGTNAAGGSINCVQKDSLGNPIPLTGGYARIGTHVHVTVSGVCTVDGFVNKYITFDVEGEFYVTSTTQGNGVTQPITSATFTGVVTVLPDTSSVASAVSLPCGLDATTAAPTLAGTCSS